MGHGGRPSDAEHRRLAVVCRVYGEGLRPFHAVALRPRRPLLSRGETTLKRCQLNQPRRALLFEFPLGDLFILNHDDGIEKYGEQGLVYTGTQKQEVVTVVTGYVPRNERGL